MTAQPTPTPPMTAQSVTAPAGVRPRIGAGKRCPTCRTLLDGGSVRFRCHPRRCAVMAADLDTEHHLADRPTDHTHDGADTGAASSRTAYEGRRRA